MSELSERPRPLDRLDEAFRFHRGNRAGFQLLAIGVGEEGVLDPHAHRAMHAAADACRRMRVGRGRPD
jgi:hypothetical protein